MELIMIESNGLQHPMALGDVDAMNRNRHILGEFLELMRADVRASAAGLGEDSSELEKDRWGQRVDRSE
jgi:hypothetical protein